MRNLQPSFILVLNSGSSNIKFAVFPVDVDLLPRTPLWNGKVQGIGGPAPNFGESGVKPYPVELDGEHPHSPILVTQQMLDDLRSCIPLIPLRQPLPLKVMGLLGYMAQRFSLYDLLSVQQSLEFSTGFYGPEANTWCELWTHINGLARKGVTIMVTNYFMDEAEYCDRVAMLSRARLIALDTLDALKRMAVNPARPDPTMGDAFIHLMESADREMEAAA